MEEDGKKLRSKSRGGNNSRPKARTNRGARSRVQRKKTLKVIESDDEDVAQTDDNAMETNNDQEHEEVQNEQMPPQIQQSATIHPQTAHQVHQSHPPVHQPQSLEAHIDLEADISQLEAPTFTTINRGPPEPMLRLRWDHKVNLIGEKVLNPMIHCCDKCLKPILIYGRMIPCKHVFCLSCAKREDKVCPRCMEKVTRVEQTGLGTVFMCTHGGTRYGNAGCRRTYLSQRDLQAHINHRHVAAPPQPIQSMQIDPPLYTHPKQEMEPPMAKVPVVPIQNNRLKPAQSHIVQPGIGNDPRVNTIVNPQVDHRNQHRSQGIMQISNYSQSTAPVSTNANLRSNLITVPIQDTTVTSHEVHSQQSHHYYHSVQPQVNYGSYNVSVPTVSQTQQYSHYTQPTHQTPHQTPHQSAHQTHQSTHQPHPSAHQPHQSAHPPHQPSHQSHQPPHQSHQSAHQPHPPTHQSHQSTHQPHPTGHPPHQSAHPPHQSVHPSHQSAHPPHQPHQPPHQTTHQSHQSHQPHQSHQSHQSHPTHQHQSHGSHGSHQTQHPPQMGYTSAPPPYVSPTTPMRPAPNNYVQEQFPPQTQWNQHQQQFYR